MMRCVSGDARLRRTTSALLRLSSRPPLLCAAVAVSPAPEDGGGGGGGEAPESEPATTPLPPPPPKPPLASRLARFATSFPLRADRYFSQRPWRKVLWCGTFAFAGFYLANTIALSFGALAVNDIVAAALSVAFVETITRAFYSEKREFPPPLWLWFANSFKLGFTYALICDAYKLGG